MSENMSILWRNLLDQFTTPIAKKAWIWYVEREKVQTMALSQATAREHTVYIKADRYAEEVEHLVVTLSPMLAFGGSPHNASTETLNDLLRFILIRHANQTLKSNLVPAYLQEL